MIIKDKVLKWLADGVESDTGSFDKPTNSQIETTETITADKKTLEDGTFVEAILFRLYFEGWIESKDWDKIKIQVEEIIKDQSLLIS